jgi:hypothetical protein
MEYSFKKIDISAPFPTRQCGHSSQTHELSVFHDPLYARVTAFRDEENWIIHYSFDLLAFDLASRNRLQKELREHYQNDHIHVITSATHTHYANDVRNPRYVEYLLELLKKETVTMEYRKTDSVTVSFQSRHSEAIGRSRISGYETGNEKLALIRFYEDDHNFLNLVYCNCHPTILDANVPYFSAEYPGYVLKKLEDRDPDTAFTFVQGAAGDISSRFVRSGQDYEALAKQGDQLYAEIIELFQEVVQKEPLQLAYREIPFTYEHEFTPIDLSNIRTDLSEREKETIAIGQQVRAQMESTGSPLFGAPIQDIIIAAWDLGAVKLVFFPNEIFSEYMNHLGNEELLASYSNGYGPYILPLNFTYVTYEMFLDTLTRDTKKRLIEVFDSI